MESDPPSTEAPPPTWPASAGEAVAGAVPPSFKIYTRGRILLAGMIGGPLGGAILIAINERRMGRPDRARWAFAIGLLATVALLLFGFLIPDSWADRSRCLAATFAIMPWIIAKELQGPAIERHRQTGGPLASWLSALGFGVLALLGTVVAIVPLVLLGPDGLGARLQVKNGAVRFTENVKETDARKLGAALDETGFFDGESREVQLDAREGKLVVRFFLHDGGWDDPKVVSAFGRLRSELAEKLEDPRLEIVLCSEDLEQKKVIR